MGLFAGALLAASLLPQDAAGCAKCHEKEFKAEQGAAHPPRAASCTDCHGGDPRATDKERAHGPGYLGKIARPAVPALCGKCHSDPRRMNPTGLPTDQHAQYLTSRHGEALAGGRLEAAVCTDCHGVHGIRGSRDPASPVHRTRVPATCGRCHSDPGLMGRLGHPADAEKLYRESVHGRLLAGGADPSAPHCATCHGNHGAVPPGVEDVGRVCGKCHVPQKAHFEASPHAFYARDGAFKECVTCHANHRIVSTRAEVEGRCAPCHEAADKEMVKWRELQDLVRAARGRFEKTSGRVERLAGAGFHADDERAALEQVRTSLLQLAPLQHTLSVPKIRAAAEVVSTGLGGIEGRLDRHERTERLKKLSLAPVWLFLAALAWLFWAKRRRIERRPPPAG